MTLLPVNLILAWGLVVRIACGENHESMPALVAKQTTGTDHCTQRFSLLVCHGIEYFRD